MGAKKKAALVQMMVFDVDGVLTDGKLVIGSQGELYKRFDTRDGLGIALLGRSGIKTAIVTARKSEIVERRAAELKIDEVYQGQGDKAIAIAALAQKYGLERSALGYVGDDLIDLPALRGVGFACAVQNAVPEVKSAADYVASAAGGDGGVREIAEFVLRAKGLWDDIVASYLEAKPLADTGQSVIQ